MSFYKPVPVALAMAATFVVALFLISLQNGLFLGKMEIRPVIVEGHIYYPDKVEVSKQGKLGFQKMHPAPSQPGGSGTYAVSVEMKHGYLLVQDPKDGRKYELSCDSEPLNSAPNGAVITTTFVLNLHGEVSRTFSPCPLF